MLGRSAPASIEEIEEFEAFLSYWPEKKKRHFPLARIEGTISERN
jgi:hypothetical protein